MLSDSPPDRDIQWSNEGVSASYKFIQRIWNLNLIILEKKDKLTSASEEKKFLIKFNKYLFKISNLIEKFHLNVAVANIYETTHLLEESLLKNTIK